MSVDINLDELESEIFNELVCVEINLNELVRAIMSF